MSGQGRGLRDRRDERDNSLDSHSAMKNATAALFHFSLFLFTFAANAATCTWTGAWDTTPSAAEDEIVIESGDLTWSSTLPATVASWTQGSGYTGTVTFDTGLSEFEVTGNVTLEGGTWTHTANPSLTSTSADWISGRGTKQLIVKCGGDFTLGSGAAINVTGKGYRNKQGPGFGEQGRGGAHGGGGYGAQGKCYGSMLSPITIGSGGRDSAATGGGAVHLTVGGTLTVDGAISANGGTVTSGDYHGAGGSIYLTANAMSGAGAISAYCGYTSGSTAGGGGRIALKLTGDGDFSGLTGTITTSAAKANCSPGTIYYETKAQAGGKGKLVLNNNGTSSDNYGVGADVFAIEGETYDFSEIVITNGGKLVIHSGATVSAAKISSRSSGYSFLEMNGGTLNLPADFEFTKIRIRNRSTASRILTGADGDLILGNDAIIYTRTAATELTVPGDLILNSGAQVTHDGNGNNNDLGYGIRLNVLGDLTLNTGSIVTADEKGYYARGQSSTLGYASSGCHGGYGQDGDATMVYGSIKYPDTLGSDSKTSARYAGGRIRLKVGGCLTVNSRITANGGFYNGGSAKTASGGSIWIDAGTLAGSGFIFARGGNASSVNSTGSGSGGRIAVYLTEDNATFDDFYAAGGEIAAPGGPVLAGSAKHETRVGKPYGACGTVYLSRTVNGVTNDCLVIRNLNSDIRNVGATIGPNVTDCEVSSVVFETNGVMVVGQDGLLQVRKDFTRSARGKDKLITVEGDADHAAGTVEFTDASLVSTVTGTNDFARLVVATPGKTVKFGTESDASLTKVGQLAVNGVEGNNVLLQSLVEGVRWPLSVYGAADVNFATVRDSDASVEGGNLIAAKDSTDGGNNVNWKFSSIVIGETITWTGTGGAGWANAASWDLEREPVDTDVVVIPAGCTYYPTLSAALTLNSLTVESGASLALAGYNLTVTNNFAVAGSLVCSASETITCSGPSVVFTGGAFTKASSTFVLDGALDQTVDFAALDYNVLRFGKSGGTATFASGFSAYQFYVASTTPVAYGFAAGETVSTSDFYLEGVGAGDTAAVTLDSAGSSGVWKFKVSRASRVQGAIVKHSDASQSAAQLCANDPSTNGGNNTYWRFGTNVRTWIGGTGGGSFNNAANWQDGLLPDDKSLVQFSENAKMVVSAPITIRELVVSGGTADFTRATNLLTVAENLTVESGATLSMTSPIEVGGNAILRSGATVTHDLIVSEQGAYTNRVHLTVANDMSVEAGATIDASQKGYGSSYRGGLGKAGGTGDNGPSHGGIGAKGMPAYDSFYAPIHPGSSSESGDAGNYAGGVVRLIVGGTLELNGTVKADSGSGNWYVSSPGSVWITAGDLEGAGSVTADCGSYLVSSDKVVGGGRVSVVLTDGDGENWTGTMTAYPCEAFRDRAVSSSGTVYYEKASEGHLGGTLTFTALNESAGFSSRHTPVPCAGWDEAADYEKVKFVTTGRAMVEFGEDMKIRDLVVTAGAGCSPRFYTTGHLITIMTRDHAKGKGWTVGGTAVNPSSVTDTGTAGTGLLYWKPVGMMILIR